MSSQYLDIKVGDQFMWKERDGCNWLTGGIYTILSTSPYTISTESGKPYHLNVNMDTTSLWEKISENSLTRSVEQQFKESHGIKPDFQDNLDEKHAKMSPFLKYVGAEEQWIKGMHEGKMKYGKKSYLDRDFRVTEFLDALERHLMAFKKGENFVPDSQFVENYHHLGAIICHAAIMLEILDKKPEMDDREGK